MHLHTTTLFKASGLSMLLAGVGFIIVGIFHPLNIPSSVVTDTWINVHIVAIVMCFFGLFGLMGLFVRQVPTIGWLGLTGFVFLSIWMGAVMCFSFIEAFIFPILATTSPTFVEDFLGMFSGTASRMDLGALPQLWLISGPVYILGQLFFGIATFKAKILPRYSGGLLALAAVLTPVGAFIPPQLQPLVMVPAGLAFVWMGYVLYAEPQKMNTVT